MRRILFFFIYLLVQGGGEQRQERDLGFGHELSAFLDVSKLSDDAKREVCLPKSLVVFLGHADLPSTFHRVEHKDGIVELVEDSTMQRYDHASMKEYWQFLVEKRDELYQSIAQGEPACKSVGQGDVLFAAVVDGPEADDTKIEFTWFSTLEGRQAWGPVADFTRKEMIYDDETLTVSQRVAGQHPELNIGFSFTRLLYAFFKTGSTFGDKEDFAKTVYLLKGHGADKPSTMWPIPYSLEQLAHRPRIDGLSINAILPHFALSEYAYALDQQKRGVNYTPSYRSILQRSMGTNEFEPLIPTMEAEPLIIPTVDEIIDRRIFQPQWSYSSNPQSPASGFLFDTQGPLFGKTDREGPTFAPLWSAKKACEILYADDPNRLAECLRSLSNEGPVTEQNAGRDGSQDAGRVGTQNIAALLIENGISIRDLQSVKSGAFQSFFRSSQDEDGNHWDELKRWASLPNGPEAFRRMGSHVGSQNIADGWTLSAGTKGPTLLLVDSCFGGQPRSNTTFIPLKEDGTYDTDINSLTLLPHTDSRLKESSTNQAFSMVTLLNTKPLAKETVSYADLNVPKLHFLTLATREGAQQKIKEKNDFYTFKMPEQDDVPIKIKEEFLTTGRTLIEKMTDDQTKDRFNGRASETWIFPALMECYLDEEGPNQSKRALCGQNILNHGELNYELAAELLKAAEVALKKYRQTPKHVLWAEFVTNTSLLMHSFDKGLFFLSPEADSLPLGIHFPEQMSLQTTPVIYFTDEEFRKDWGDLAERLMAKYRIALQEPFVKLDAETTALKETWITFNALHHFKPTPVREDYAIPTWFTFYETMLDNLAKLKFVQLPAFREIMQVFKDGITLKENVVNAKVMNELRNTYPQLDEFFKLGDDAQRGAIKKLLQRKPESKEKISIPELEHRLTTLRDSLKQGLIKK